MTRRFYKHKLLLDEGFFYKKSLPITNGRFDVKHITGDYKKRGLPDSEVYQSAIKYKRIVVTFNEKDFRDLAKISNETGVIGVSSTLTLDQIDKKLTALLNKSTKKSLLGKLTTISGEEQI